MRSAFVNEVKRRKKEFKVARIAGNLMLKCLTDKLIKWIKIRKVSRTSNGCLQSDDSAVHIPMFVEGCKVWTKCNESFLKPKHQDYFCGKGSVVLTQ